MHLNKWGLAVLALVCGATTVSVASAEPLERAEKVGRFFHRNVCSHAHAADVAHCHSRVVTDEQGVEIDTQVTPNAAPSGCGPSILRSAFDITSDGTATIAIVAASG